MKRMFNFHGGTVVHGLTIPASSYAMVILHTTGEMVIIGLFFLTIVSTLFLIATLSRFFVNLNKYYSDFNQPDNSPFI